MILGRYNFFLILTLLCSLALVQCGGGSDDSCSNCGGSSGFSSEDLDDNNRSIDEIGGSPFTEIEMLQSYLMTRNFLSTLDTFDSNFQLTPLPSENTSFLKYAIISFCDDGGNVDLSSSLFDYSDCSFKWDNYTYKQNGSMAIDTKTISKFEITYDYQMVIIGNNANFTYTLTGGVDAQTFSKSNLYDLDLEGEVKGNQFSFLGQLVQDSEGKFTGSLIIIFNTLINTCALEDFDPSSEDDYMTACSF